MPPSYTHTIHVTPEQTRLTLAAVIRQALPEQSWSQIKQLIWTRRIFVNGNLSIDAGRRLKPGEIIGVLAESAAPPPDEGQVEIVHQDQAVVVVFKPAGLTSVRHREELAWPADRRQRQPTLDEILPRLLGKVGVKGSRRGGLPQVRAVHRIDRETSGLMVFARSVDAERHLGLQFRDHSIGRRYYALVHGAIESQTFDTMLVRDRGDGRRGSGNPTKDNEGKRAVTHVEVIERMARHTLVACELETGRTHQIRIHLSEAGHPLCGDRIYRKPPGREPIKDDSGAPRVCLHAAELAFDHPITGKRVEFDIDPPTDFLQVLEKLRRKK